MKKKIAELNLQVAVEALGQHLRDNETVDVELRHIVGLVINRKFARASYRLGYEIDRVGSTDEHLMLQNLQLAIEDLLDAV